MLYYKFEYINFMINKTKENEEIIKNCWNIKFTKKINNSKNFINDIYNGYLNLFF